MTDDNIRALLPCPFCGGDGSVVSHADEDEWYWWVECMDCRASTLQEYGTESSARGAWNMRSPRS